MDARELTKKYENLSNRTRELEKQVEFLTQEMEHQRIILGDMKIDVQMLQRAR